MKGHFPKTDQGSFLSIFFSRSRKNIKYAGRRYLAHAQSRKVPSMQYAAREKGNAPTPIRYGHVSLLWLLCSFCSHDRATAGRDAGSERFSGNPGCSCLPTILRLFWRSVRDRILRVTAMTALAIGGTWAPNVIRR